MQLELKRYNSKTAVEAFLVRNGITDGRIEERGGRLVISIPSSRYSARDLRVIKRHFSFYDLFYWSREGIENVILWEKPERINSVLAEFRVLFADLNFDVIVSPEARGFILGGIFLREFNKPLITLRKYKKIYEKIPGTKLNYQNWKGQEEELYIFEHSIRGKEALFLDDIIETGNSLKTAHQLLNRYGLRITGAFYLMDGTRREIRDSFPFPIRSLLKFNNLLEER